MRIDNRFIKQISAFAGISLIFKTEKKNEYIMLTELEKKIIASIQGNIAITERPFLEIAERLEIDEETLLERLKSLCDRGIIRRFGATIRHQKSGFEANAMVAWKIDEDQINRVGEKLAAFSEVSHCYRRNPTKEWPYNLYTMIHAQDEDSCREIARKMSAETSAGIYTLLFSRRELKKTSMQYFSADDD
jgi:DNA-binding Lrp family transcriptional regulator